MELSKENNNFITLYPIILKYIGILYIKKTDFNEIFNFHQSCKFTEHHKALFF